MTSFPVFPYYRPPLPVTLRSLPVVMTSLPVDRRTFKSDMTSFPMVHNGQYVYPMAYATERQSALPDANPEPEMG